jgi:hypothetical protein
MVANMVEKKRYFSLDIIFYKIYVIRKMLGGNGSVAEQGFQG